uniref:Protein EARLY RESPONSIVE TO DEHYDRATION 15-like n=1 Tax=Nelumbo nucifera TaxID=4432 RepID=A0A822YB42_NELNU|nr:TPA_asm: hypothetical protein HUJ06_030980 [Nelumbo nucifera]
MALVSRMRSTLNPNAPLFIPAAYQQVEDFSPEWWELVKTSTWFMDYWLAQHQEEESFIGNANEDDDVVNLLPDAFDLDADEDMDAQLEEFILSSEENGSALSASKPQNGIHFAHCVFLCYLRLDIPTINRD